MKVIKIPRYFFLKNGHIRTSVSFLRKLITTRSKTIAIDFSLMKDSTKGDITVFGAQIEKAYVEHGKSFFRSGKLPSDRKMKKLLTFSGKTVHENKPLPQYISEGDKATLINPTLIDTFVKDLRKIGIKEYFFPFNIFLTEVIGNAVEHGIENRKINWWLTQDIDFGTKSIIYTFVDMGNGIIDTHKKARLPLKYWFLNDSRIVIDSFNGKLGSSTKLSNRGKGLPQLRGLIASEIVSNLTIITNKVNLRFKNDRFYSGKNPNFVGTFYSWTINSYNFEKWMNSQLKSPRTLVQN